MNVRPQPLFIPERPLPKPDADAIPIGRWTLIYLLGFLVGALEFNIWFALCIPAAMWLLHSKKVK
jgi:hypothetical protein